MAKRTNLEIVGSGMELLQWQYEDLEWQTSVSPTMFSWGVLALAVVPIALSLTLCVYGDDLPQAVESILALCFGLLPLLWIVRHVLRYLLRSQKKESSPHSPVVFTSTGVIWDGEGHPWYSEQQRLTGVSLQGDCLRLTFRRARKYEIEIPIPARVEKDVRELVELLEAKTGSKHNRETQLDATDASSHRGTATRHRG